MIKKILISQIIVVFCFCGLFVMKNSEKQKTNLHVEKMPLIKDDTFFSNNKEPVPERGPEYIKWLSTTVRIDVKGGCGSGCIVYYDKEKDWAYVQSCGHLWEGQMTAIEGKARKIECDIVVEYHNNMKLKQPESYKGEVLYFSNSIGRDIALLRFRPNWVPNFIPIAPSGWNYNKNQTLHSTGCDGKTEVAHYQVEVVGMKESNWNYLITTKNSPRPGRSGGGLFDDDYYVGVCWGTSDYTGKGNGYFTTIDTIREYNKINGYGWINDVLTDLARRIPIKDRNNPQQIYHKNYIPMPF